MRVLVTGANGFIGGALLSRLRLDVGTAVRAAARRPMGDSPDSVSVGDLTSGTDWTAAIRDVNIVVHTAARVHQMNASSRGALDDFRRVNVDGTLNLARQAAAAGVRRLVFVSSIKVLGEATLPGHPYTAHNDPAPIDPYAISKLEAEEGLTRLARETGLQVVIVRPPLVYGPGVKANFASMMRWVHRRVPLPLGAIQNQRSLVGLDNLVDLLAVCVHHPDAANRKLLVSDGEDLSTTELLRRIGSALGTPALLVPVPIRALRAVARLAGKLDHVTRLCSSLQVDIAETRRVLGWAPPTTTEIGLRETAAYFLAQHQR